MNTNASTLSTKTAVSHTAYDGMRMRAGVTSDAGRATASAKQTIVNTPERPIVRDNPDAERADELNDDRGGHVAGCVLSPESAATRPRGPATTLPTTATRNVGGDARIEKVLAASAPMARR